MAVDSAICQSSVVKKQSVVSYSGVEERDSLLALLMNWLSQLLSQCSCSTHSQSSCRQGRQLLPLLAKLLPNLPTSHHLPLLKLTLWTIEILPEVRMHIIYYNSRLSLIWIGLYTFICVCIYSSQTVLEHNRPFCSYLCD